jgi:MSHA biogenesis protein MshO
MVQGFTLIEMVMVIVITGIIAGVLSVFITGPMTGYVDLARRAELVDASEMALRRVARDIRRALPNSIRTGAGMIEMVNTLDAAVYRYYPPPGSPAGRLAFGTSDDQFNVYGHFTRIDGSINDLVINNTNNVDVYARNNVITPAGTTITVTAAGPEDQVTLNPPVTLTPFTSDPPELVDSMVGRRAYLIDGPVTYKCEGGFLNRYTGHGLSTTAGNTTGASVAVLTAHVDCGNTTFQYIPGTTSRGALAVLTIALTDAGESITLLHQVHVDNVP